MTIPTRQCVTAAVVLAAWAFGSVSTASAQAARSVAAAKELTQALDAAKLEAIAAPDPGDPGTFVAALYFAGAQLLVVSAKYSAPPLLVAKMKSKDYRDIYIDLNSASIAATKVFIIDQNADGLVAKPEDQACDTWEAGAKQVSFDGEWRKAKMSEEEYQKAFATADERYAKILSLLTAQAKGPGL
jgi:hypothetical protein